MLSAMPDTTWLPWCVMQAKPWTRLTRTAAAMPAPRPAQAEPLTAAVAAAAKAEASILPSSPMSTTPERSEKRPPRDARTRGVAPRTVAAASSATSSAKSLMVQDGEVPRTARRRSCRGAEQRCEGAAQHLLERAADQDDEPLDDDDDVAGQRRHIERQLRPALVQRAEQHGGQEDPSGMIAAHQRHGD